MNHTLQGMLKINCCYDGPGLWACKYCAQVASKLVSDQWWCSS